ncbi:Sec8 exocyst complex component specific domain-containing protein [Mycena indigotica]|uniref:Exocyst complex component Sec8 n=1 Tax=Mycena indigotica TaxID=2126181 RepID=A0A8H6SZJ8_9AGAR|nr:Sec8 exocyst complex component specific domain-containing protein [Mycena indigotica]KAF7306760.1 Sec8 exocyst complex component specific domain-containing protein [Mycena indigotica]
MSRQAPFPNRRVRSPSLSNTEGPPSSNTRPLQISRPPSRPTTPSNESRRMPRSEESPPNRPQRSGLRSRESEYSSSYRDSVSTDVSTSYRSRPPAPNGSTTRSTPQRNRTGEEPPPAMNTVLSAFQSAGSRRRGMTNDSEEMDYQRERRQEIEAEKLKQQRIRDKAPGRKPTGKTRLGDIDAVLDQVKDGWEFVVDPEFNHVDLALELLDDKSAGKDMDSFRRTKNMLSKALKGSVDTHYQAFAASLPHHASLISHLTATQTQISEARTSLQESKDALGSKRADLVQLWTRRQTLDEMMRLLDQIEHLKSVPDLLESLMSEKRLLQASVLLVRSLKIINKSEMIEIGAVSDLRVYLNSQETALREILIDELQSHLYLKSFWCESRWAAYTPNQQSFPKVEFEAEVELKPSTNPTSSPSEETFRQTRLTRFLNDLALRPNDPPYDLNDPTFGSNSSETLVGRSSASIAAATASNPESDSFSYIETLLEAFAVLGKLGSALDNIGQRLPSEVFTLVETTLDEVEERAEYGRSRSTFSLSGVSGRHDGVYTFCTDSTSTSTTSKAAWKVSNLRLVALESSAKQVDHEVLKDFFWTAYSKLDAVAQGLRVVYEVANRIGSRRDFKDASGAKPGALFPLSEIWTSVQAEVRTLIYDYLVDENQGSVSGRNPISSINEILREGKFSRDKSKAVFRFADTDVKQTNKALKPHEDELTRVLKDTMPGLVQTTESTVQAALSTVGTDDRLLGAGQHHRLLIRADAFHVTVLFQPTLAFLDRVSDVLPSGMESARESTAVLDDFVLRVYLPQLEEKVSLLFHQAVTGPEAFQPDSSSSRLSPEPLVKASTQLMALINSLCAMLLKSPFHRENYSRLILSVMIQFYQRCSDRFQDLVSVPNPKEPDAESHPALSAQWAQRSELAPCLAEMLTTTESDLPKQQRLCKQETHLELNFLGQTDIKRTDLIVSIRNLGALASLYRSVSWFASELSILKSTSDDTLMSPTNLEPPSAVTPYTPFLPPLPTVASADKLQLPLSREMALRFQALLKTYEQLSELILDSIRIDTRCRAIHYLESSLKFGNYSIEREAGEPDPHIVDLNNELSECNDFATTCLPKRERRFVFMGLSNLMEQLLISGARHLRLPTPLGVKKILRNILALQQSVRTLTNEQNSTEFEHAKRYYQLFSVTPQEMLDGIRKKQDFTFDEYQIMLNLQCGVVEGSGEGAKPVDRNFSMYVIDLHGLEMEASS